MYYAIITNPAAGGITVDRKRSILAKPAQILRAKIYGLDTVSAEDFRRCAQDVAQHCEVLVVAGGDGTLADVFNVVDTRQKPLGYLPLGSGNAMRYALKYKGKSVDIAQRIRDGKIRKCDLIECNGKKRSLTAALGFEGAVIEVRNRYAAQNINGIKAYAAAALEAYFFKYRRTRGILTIDDEKFETQNLLSLKVVKHPYYGYGMRVLPEARLDDRRLHVCWTNAGFFKTVFGAIDAFTVGRRTGKYRSGRRLCVGLQRPLTLQLDGDSGWRADRFDFRLLPKALHIKC